MMFRPVSVQVLFKARRYSEQEIETQCQQMDEGVDEKTTSDNAPAMDIPDVTVHLKIKDGRTIADMSHLYQIY